MTTETTAETSSPSMIDLVKVQEVLDTLRPFLQADGGDCELVNVTDDGVVQLRLMGACGTCPSSTMTLKMGIEEQLKQHIPAIKEVVSV
ncbi:MAG: NifU family protein [Vampirovibrionales bacterium]|nr:NifU family protein [Vampirovibrionales bacterium]